MVVSDRVRARACLREDKGKEEEEETARREGGREGLSECVWVAYGPLIVHGPFMDPRIRERKSSSVCIVSYVHDVDIYVGAAVCRYARGLICTERAHFFALPIRILY